MEAELLNFISSNESVENEDDMLVHFEQVMDEEGVNLNFTNEEGLTPLLLLCKSKHSRYRCIEKLLRKKPATLAVSEGPCSTANTANVNQPDNRGKNCLFWLVENGAKHIKNVLELLIQERIDVNHVDKNQENFLFRLVSSYSGSDIVDIINLLVANGINVQQKNRYGENVFFHLVRNSSQNQKIIGIIDLLISLRVDIKCIALNEENVLYPLISKYKGDNILEIIRHLLTLGVDARQLNNKNVNILFPLIANKDLKENMMEL